MTREEKLALAGDYALGLLEGADRAACKALILRDPELAAMVDRLGLRLAALDAAAEPEPAPPGLWDRIAAELVDAPGGAPDAGRVLRPRRGWPRSPAWARPMALAASLLAAIGVGYLAGVSGRDSAEPVATAVLLAEGDGRPGAIVEAFADDSIRVLPVRDFAVPAGQIMQVWTLPDRTTGPVSLGTLRRLAPARLEGPDLAPPLEGQLYEITLEPAPGSPTGKPTGPILVKGFARLAGAPGPS